MFGTNIPWPNPQYSIDRIYWLFTGRHIDLTNPLTGPFYFIQEVQLVGLILSVVFLVIFIYLHLKLERLHHAVHERRHEEEEAVSSMMRGQGAEHPNRIRWARITELIGSSNPNDWKSAIMDADVLLGQLLDERGFIGDDIGQKLQSASRGQFASIEAAWEAHRTRNHIAHGGPEYILSDREAKQAFDNFRRVFEEFNYI